MMLMKIVLIQWIVSVISDKQIVIPLDIEQLILNIRIDDWDYCEENLNENCEILLEELVHCEEILLTDSTFRSSSHYKENFHRHKQILTKYQSHCDDTSTNSLIDEFFHFKDD